MSLYSAFGPTDSSTFHLMMMLFVFDPIVESVLEGSPQVLSYEERGSCVAKKRRSLFTGHFQRGVVQARQ